MFFIILRWYEEVKHAFLTNHAIVYGSPVQEYVPPRFDTMNADKSCVSEPSSDATDLRITCIASSLNTLLQVVLSCRYSFDVNQSVWWAELDSYVMIRFDGISSTKKDALLDDIRSIA